jgi:hypothetical protein
MNVILLSVILLCVILLNASAPEKGQNSKNIFPHEFVIRMKVSDWIKL